MTPTTATIEPLRPVRRPSAAPGEPARQAPLRLLPAPSPEAARRPRPVVFYAIIVILTVAAILGAQLLLSITLSGGAYQISSLQTEQRDLGRIKDVIDQDIDRYESPQHLAADAAALGMVPDSQPAYLRLSDGAVLGAPAGASGQAAANTVPNELAASLPVVGQDSGQTDVAAAVSTPAPVSVDTQAPEGSDAAQQPADAAQTQPAQPSGPQPVTGQLPGPSTH